MMAMVLTFNLTYMRSIYRVLYYLIAAAVITAVASCEPEEDEATQRRLFRPVAKGDLVAQGNRITATWQDIKEAVSYTAQVSRDTFRTIDQTVEVDTNAIVFEGLEWSTLYQVQVQANAATEAQNSKMSALGAAKTEKFPTILITPGVSDVTDVAARVRWATSG